MEFIIGCIYVFCFVNNLKFYKVNEKKKLKKFGFIEYFLIMIVNYFL